MCTKKLSFCENAKIVGGGGVGGLVGGGGGWLVAGWGLGCCGVLGM